MRLVGGWPVGLAASGGLKPSAGLLRVSRNPKGVVKSVTQRAKPAGHDERCLHPHVRELASRFQPEQSVYYVNKQWVTAVISPSHAGFIADARLGGLGFAPLFCGFAGRQFPDAQCGVAHWPPHAGFYCVKRRTQRTKTPPTSCQW
jgi:hypothetical protein